MVSMKISEREEALRRVRFELAAFGPGSCHVMQIRPVGFTEIKAD